MESNKLHSGFLVFEKKSDYDDCVEYIAKKKELIPKSIGLELGRMILFNKITKQEKDEVLNVASGAEWRDEFSLSLGS